MPPWIADWYGGGNSSGPIVETVCTLDCVSSETDGQNDDISYGERARAIARRDPRARTRSRERTSVYRTDRIAAVRAVRDILVLQQRLPLALLAVSHAERRWDQFTATIRQARFASIV